MVRRLVKIVVFVIALLVATLGVAAWKANDWLESHRDEIAERASDQAGRPIRFEHLRVSLRGGPGVVATGVEVGSESEAATGIRLKAERVDVRLDLLALLAGRVELRSVAVQAPEIRLAIPPVSPTGKLLREMPPSPVLPLSLRRLSATDLMIVGSTGGDPSRELVFRVPQLKATDLVPGETIQLTLLANLLGGIEADLQVSGSLGPVGSDGSLGGATLDVEAKFGPADIEALSANPLVATRIPADVAMAGSLTAGAHLTGPMTGPAVEVHVDATGSDLRMRGQLRKPKGLRAEANLQISPTGLLDKIFVALGSLEIHGTGQVRREGHPALTLDLRSNRWPLDEVATLAPAAAPFALEGSAEIDLDVAVRHSSKPEVSARGTISLTGAGATIPGPGLRLSGLDTRLEIQENSLRVPPSNIEIAGNPARVEATFDRLRPPHGSFSARSARLDLGDLTGDGSTGDLARRVVLEGRVRTQESRPELSLDLSAEAGVFKRTPFRALSAKLRVADPLTHIDSFDVTALSGQVSASGSIDRREPQRVGFRMQMSASGLDLTQIPGRDSESSGIGRQIVGGRLNANLKLAGVRGPAGVDKESLQGQGRFEIRDGALKGLNPGERIMGRLREYPILSRIVSNRLRKEGLDLSEPMGMSFDKLAANLQIANARIGVRDLVLHTDDYSVTGSGTISFDRRVELDGLFTASTALTAQMVQKARVLGRLKNADGRIEIPFRATGVPPDIHFEIDREALRKLLREGGPPQHRPGERLHQLLERRPHPFLDRLRRGH